MHLSELTANSHIGGFMPINVVTLVYPPNRPFVQKSSYSREEVFWMTGGWRDESGEPVPRLPAYPLTMFDTINRVTADGGKYGKGFVSAMLCLQPIPWFMRCHFIGDGVMPGCLQLDALWQLSGFFGGWTGFRGRGRARRGGIKLIGEITSKVLIVEYRVSIIQSRRGVIRSTGQVYADDGLVAESDGPMTTIIVPSQS